MKTWRLGYLLCIAGAAVFAEPSITGTVTGPEGAPLVGGGVKAYLWNSHHWEIAAVVDTDDSGAYALTSLVTGVYLVGFEDPMGAFASQFFTNSPVCNEAMPIMVLPDSTVSNINARLAVAGKIAGKVTDTADGAPLSHIRVLAEIWNRTRWSPLVEAETDGKGDYLLGGLPAGRYYAIRFQDTNGVYASEWYDSVLNHDEVAVIMLPAGEVAGGRNAALAPAGAISGTVTVRDGGAPVPGVLASAHRWNGGAWEQSESGQTDALGNYMIRGLSAGPHRVVFHQQAGNLAGQWYSNAVFADEAISVTVTPPGTVSNIDVSLGLGTRIAGRITDKNIVSLQGIEVTAYLQNGSDWERLLTAYSDPNGDYMLGGLPPGEYTLFFEDVSERHLSEWFDGATTVDESTSFTAMAGIAVSNQNAALRLAASIAGTVTGPDGGPLQGIQTAAYAWDGADMTYVSSDVTVTDGSYEIRGLTAGLYRIEFADYASGNYVDEWFSNATDVALADDVAVGEGEQVRGLDASLAAVPATGIAGTVTGPDGETPLTTVQVEAYAWDGSNLSYAASSSTASNGVYYIHPLDPGPYRVEFFDYTGAHLTQWYSNAPSSETAADVQVGEGEVVSNINASLIEVPMTGIAGTVTDEDGSAPIASILVSAYSWNGSSWAFAGSDSSVSNGSYTIRPLAPGTYRIRFFASSGSHLTEWFSNATDVASATDVTVAGGEVATNINAAMTAVPAAAIAGTVTDADGAAPLGKIDVYAYRWDGTNWIYAAWAATASNGVYTIGGLSEDTYRVLFNDSTGIFVSEWFSNATDVAAAAAVPVGNDETVSNINAELTAVPVANAAITGLVTGPDGVEPLAAITVYVSVWDGMRWSSAGLGETDSNGVYRVKALFPNTYRVEFYDASMQYRGEWYSNASDVASATDVTVGKGEAVPGIDASLDLAPITGLSGVITGTNGTDLLEGIEVEARVWDGAVWTSAGVAVTGSNGTYLIGGLSANMYRVRFHDPSGTYVEEWYSNATDVASAADVQVVDDEVVGGIDAALEPVREPLRPFIVGLNGAQGDEWVVLFIGESGFNYILQSAPQLTDEWIDTGSWTNGLEGTNMLRCLDTSGHGFWRLRVTP